MLKNKYQSYAIATQTVAKTRQIVMLYEGGIRFLQQAKEAMADNRIEDRYKSLTKASNIVTGLQSCLDFENGGSVAQILYNFYASLDTRIFSLHRSNDASACDALIEELRQMRDVWEEIDQNTVGQSPVNTTSGAPSVGQATPASPDQNIILSA